VGKNASFFAKKFACSDENIDDFLNINSVLSFFGSAALRGSGFEEQLLCMADKCILYNKYDINLLIIYGFPSLRIFCLTFHFDIPHFDIFFGKMSTKKLLISLPEGS
jgi:hypothetical protein